MPPPGYLHWSDDWFSLLPWLNGRFVQRLAGLQWQLGSPVVRQETHASTHVCQKPFQDDNAPSVRVAYEFACSFQGMFYSDYQALHDSLLFGSTVRWCPGLWAREYFDAAGTFRLSRPTAWGTVPGVDETTFPQTGADSISGQDVVMAAAGYVNYFPLFLVKVDALSNSIQTVNGLEFSATMSECIEVI